MAGVNSTGSDPQDTPPPNLSVPVSLPLSLLMGFCLGVANIIPGVSGGTFLLVFGIYERVFAIVNQINGPFIRCLLSLSRSAFRRQGRDQTGADLVGFLRDTGVLFLIKLALGAAGAIVCLSGLMKFLLLHHFSVTYALFFGLILASVVIPVRMMKGGGARHLVCLLAGLGFTVFISMTVNPYDKIRVKSDTLARQYDALEQGVRDVARPVETRLSFSGRYSPKEYLYIGFAGALAISATVLPGISGSLVLILMGTYFDVISAISSLGRLSLDTFAFLGMFGLGVMVGGLLFARLVSYVLARFYNAAMAFLTGLMAGSLYALWPFKQTVVMARQYVREDGHIRILENVSVQTNINVLPDSGEPLVAALAFFVLGCLIMAGFMAADPARSGQ